MDVAILQDIFSCKRLAAVIPLTMGLFRGYTTASTTVSVHLSSSWTADASRATILTPGCRSDRQFNDLHVGSASRECSPFR
jgi:hypothetical protein